MSWKFDRTRLITPALIVGFVLIWHFYVTWFNVSKFIVPPPLEVWDALVELLTTPSTLRHTWATIALSAGIDIKIVKRPPGKPTI